MRKIIRDRDRGEDTDSVERSGMQSMCVCVCVSFFFSLSIEKKVVPPSPLLVQLRHLFRCVLERYAMLWSPRQPPLRESEHPGTPRKIVH